MKILLVGGGSSRERAVSLVTADNIERGLREGGHQVTRINVDDEIEVVQHWNSGYDLVFLGLHGRRGEDGLLQSVLERQEIPFTGAGSQPSLLAFHKSASKLIFDQEGIPTAAWHYHRHEVGSELPRNDFDFPFVIKPDNEGSTMGLSVIRSRDDLVAAREVSGQFYHLLYEKFIPGCEITVGVLDGRALPIVEIFPGHELYDYESKYTHGASRYEVPAELPSDLTERVQTLAEKAVKVLGVEVYARVDFRLDPDNKPWCLEVNTLPGMTETSLLPMAAGAAGMTFVELLDKIAGLSLQKRR
ncbi:MAG: D-alanine--D-alanine ligase [Candidatus Marinimicrobia bacterium]|nr:D-alanine--D-alanine ligase [Candidatus Neomarinimicrobiota bacterium]